MHERHGDARAARHTRCAGGQRELTALTEYGVPVIETTGAGSHHARSTGDEAGGLTSAAAIFLVAVVTTVAAVVSAATGHGFGVVFNLLYLIVTIYVALRIYVDDRFTAVIVPPIVYALAVFVGGFFDSEETSHTFVRVFENTFVNVSFGAPWLVGATIAAIVIAIVRGRGEAVASRRR